MQIMMREPINCIIEEEENSYKCILMIQDGIERIENIRTLEEAIKEYKKMALCYNNEKIKSKNINIYKKEKSMIESNLYFKI